MINSIFLSNTKESTVPKKKKSMPIYSDSSMGKKISNSKTLEDYTNKRLSELESKYNIEVINSESDEDIQDSKIINKQ